MFLHLSVILSTGGSAWRSGGMHGKGGHVWWGGRAWWQRGCAWWKDRMLWARGRVWEGGYCSGRYASYWNAFLFCSFLSSIWSSNQSLLSMKISTQAPHDSILLNGTRFAHNLQTFWRLKMFMPGVKHANEPFFNKGLARGPSLVGAVILLSCRHSCDVKPW